MSKSKAEPAYLDAHLEVEVRVKDLLGRMTLREKLRQLGCVWSSDLAKDGAFDAETAAGHLSDGIGQITRIGANTGLKPADNAAFANAIQRPPSFTRRRWPVSAPGGRLNTPRPLAWLPRSSRSWCGRWRMQRVRRCWR